MTSALILPLALALDAWLGEPRRLHPLVGFGRLAQTLEDRLHCDSIWRGALALLLLILPLTLVAILIDRLPWSLAFDILLLYLAIGWRSLGEHAGRVREALAAGDLPGARQAVGYMVSRDTSSLDPDAIASAILSLLENPGVYQRLRDNGLAGVRQHYSWPAHAETYLAAARPLPKRHVPIPIAPKRSQRYRDRALFTDLDQCLLGHDEGLRQFIALLGSHRKCTTFGIATGRRLDSALLIIKQYGIPRPDVLITSLGTEIHYAPHLERDPFWSEHIGYLWQPAAVRRASRPDTR